MKVSSLAVGMNSLPTPKIATPIADAKKATATEIVTNLLFRTHSITRLYAFLILLKRRPSPPLIFSAERSLDAIMGTSVTAMKRADNRANVTVSARSRNIRAASPCVKTMGTNTAIVVNVEAVIAMPTSLAPFFAAVIRSSPFSCMCRNMFSSTTMELSTTMPTASASPPSEIIFIVMPVANIGRNAARSDIGMARPMITTGLTRRRNRYSTTTASSAPHIRSFLTWPIARLMKSAESNSATIFTPGGRCGVSSAIFSHTCLETSTVLEPDCFMTIIIAAGSRLSRAITSFSACVSRILATSLSRITAPLLTPSTTSSISARFWNSPSALTR